MKKIFVLMFILFASVSFIMGCSGGGGDDDSAVRSIRVSAKSETSGVSGMQKSITYSDATDPYAGSGFTHIDGILFWNVPSILAYQVTSDATNSTITRWDIGAESGINDEKAEGVAPFLKAGSSFSGIATNEFFTITTTDAVLNTGIGDFILSRWLPLNFDEMTPIAQPSTFNVDYVWVNPKLTDIFGVTTGGVKSFITNGLEQGTDGTYLPYRFTRNGTRVTDILDNVFPTHTSYSLFKFDTHYPLKPATSGKYIFTPHVTKPIIVKMKWYNCGTDSGTPSVTTNTIGSGGVTVEFGDGANTAETQAKVIRDVWNIFKCSPANAYSSSQPWDEETFFIFPMSQYSADPTKVAKINVGAYVTTEDSINITVDIQKTIGAYYMLGNMVFPVLKPDTGTTLNSPMGIEIKFTDSVLIQ